MAGKGESGRPARHGSRTVSVRLQRGPGGVDEPTAIYVLSDSWGVSAALASRLAALLFGNAICLQ